MKRLDFPGYRPKVPAAMDQGLIIRMGRSTTNEGPMTACKGHVAGSSFVTTGILKE
jgi:hypothetical protein